MIASPRPVPPYFRVVDGVGLAERLEQLADLLRRHADAGVAHAEARASRRPVASRHASSVIVPALGELAGVAQEVEQALPHLGQVGVHRAEVRPRSATSSVLPFFSTSGSMVVATSPDKVGDVERLEEQLHLAGLDLGEVEDVVDERQQVLAGRVDLLQVGDELVLPARRSPLPGASRCSR